MNGLALCAGIGGLELGLRGVWQDLRTVCWVERDAYAASVLVSRMQEGALDEAPVWDDLATFDGAAWRGCVDLVSAGYPCQPFSLAGKRRGESDERHLWPHVARVIREVGPRWVVLENVPGHVSLGLSDVLGSLAEMGYDAEWGCYTAEQAGCAHRRERLFVLAHATGTRQHEGQDAGAGGGDAAEDGCGSAEPQRGCREYCVAHADGSWELQSSGRVAEGELWACCAGSGSSPSLVHPDDAERWPCGVRCGSAGQGAGGGGQADCWLGESGQVCGFEWASLRPPAPDSADAWEWIAANDPDALPAVEPGIRGVADGIPERLEPAVRRHRLRCLGNAVVPAQAAMAVSDLLERYPRLLVGKTVDGVFVPDELPDEEG